MPKSVASSETQAIEVPAQIGPSQAQQRRPSMLQRFTTATLGYLSLSYQGEEKELVLAEEDEILGFYAEDLAHEQMFGTSQIHKSLNGPPEGFPTVEEQSEIFTPQLYEGEPGPRVPLQGRRRSTVATTIQSITRKFGFWDEDFHAERIHIVATLFTNYVFLVVGFLAVLLIYWGAYHNRVFRYANVKYAVFIGDAQMGELSPVLGLLVTFFFSKVPAIAALGKFDIWNATRIADSALEHGNTIEEEVFRQVHQQKYWAAYFVHENATLSMYEALVGLNASFNPTTDLMSVVYETGRDYNAVNNYFSSISQTIVRGFHSYIAKTDWVSYMVQALNSTQADNVLDHAPQLLTSLPSFEVNDRIIVLELVVQAPLQIGLIYLCIFTFFQFIFSAPIHMFIASKIKGLRFVIYHIISSQVAYVVLGLAYVTLNTAFGVSYSNAFGNLGFLVIWAFAFLTMSSVGSLLEVLVLLCIIYKPPMIGVVLLLVSVLNLAPTISPIILCPDFYRYGYAMPVPNSYQLMQVAFFDSYKGNMGLHIGILVAWIVVTNCAMPFVMKKVGAKLKTIAEQMKAQKK